MALRQAEQLQLSNLNDIAVMLHELGIPEETILAKAEPKIKELTDTAKGKVVLKYDENGVPHFEHIDLRSDFVRTRFNTESTMLSLRAKIVGVPIDIKVKKDDEVFTNKEVASSLRELALIVEKMPVEMVPHGHDDWSREPGVLPKSLAEKEEASAPVADTTPVVDTAPVAETAPAVETTPSVETAPVAESAPVVETATVAESAAATLPGESVVSAPEDNALPGESVTATKTEVPAAPTEQSMV